MPAIRLTKTIVDGIDHPSDRQALYYDTQLSSFVYDLLARRMRHPSYGGQTRFLRQVRELYDVSETGQRVLL